MSVKYSFITRWEAKASCREVWNAIRNPLQWPEWWKDFVEVVELKIGDEHGIGSVIRYTLQSPAKYKLTFDMELKERIEYKTLGGSATGELEGTGRWYFIENNGVTLIDCQWDVVTTKPWMNWFAFILKPAFRYNHYLVMKNGARCLASRIGKEVRILA